MEWNYVLLWIAGPSCVIIFIQGSRTSPRLVGWMSVVVGIAAVATVLWFLQPQIAGFVTGSLWALFVLAPSLLNRRAVQLSSRQQFALASRFSQVAGWLHPFDGMWQQSRLLRALDLIEAGQTNAAIEILEKLKSAPKRIARLAQLHIFRARMQWPQLVDWVQSNCDARMIGREPNVLSLYLRGLGEIGKVDELLLTLDRHRSAIDAPQHIYSRGIYRLLAFVFAGQPAQASVILGRQLSFMPPMIQQFWLATAELATDRPQGGMNQLQGLQALAPPGLAASIAHRLQSPPHAPVLSGQAHEILRRLDQEADQEDRYALRSRASQRPWGTYTLILLNLIMFAMEWFLGGTMDPATALRLGAFEPTAVNHGQYWRLLTANFLHFGSAHIVMNMTALFLLGPFVERALGLWRYVLVYLLSGIGAIATVWALQTWHLVEPGFLVGASGAIMGLIGATAAILLRGWLRERARYAARRFRVILAVVVMQVIFDSLTPEVSGSAHLAGVVWGFLLVHLMTHRTSAPAQVPRVLP